MMTHMNVTRVGDFELVWGESLRWDDRRQRLYFVDCATRCLHWLNGGAPPLHTLELPSMPTGLVLTESNALVACLDDGLFLVDPDAGTCALLSPYPEGMQGRANDANADGSGNLVTGTLNLAPAPGAFWWYSTRHGWRLLDDDISNANGPVVIEVDGEPTLIFADTPALVSYAYPYNAAAGRVGPRRVFGDHGALGGAPDGAAADAGEGVWSCVLGAGTIARFTGSGLDRTIAVPPPNPSDVAFGGPELDQLFVVAIAVDLGGSPPVPESSWLMVVDGVGARGRPEDRFALH
jgi:sugar lactone lactonase YvrE